MSNILTKENIVLGLDSVSRDESIDLAGKKLVERGYVNHKTNFTFGTQNEDGKYVLAGENRSLTTEELINFIELTSCYVYCKFNVFSWNISCFFNSFHD